MNFFTRFGLIKNVSIKNIKQNIRENIVHTVFVLRNQHQNFAPNKVPPLILLICHQNFNADSVKPIL